MSLDSPASPHALSCQISSAGRACRLSLLVGLSGLEPPTSRLSGVRSNRLSYKPIFPGFEAISVSSATIAVGGDKRDRTVDLLLAKQALSQLSYTPM